MATSLISAYDQYQHSENWKEIGKSFCYGAFIGFLSPAILTFRIIDNYIDKI